MADWYVSSVLHAAVAQFAVSTAYTVGQLIRQLAAPTVGNERVFRCTTAGTTAGSEPAWNLGAGATTTSGTAVFTEVTANATYNWSAPAARLKLAQTRAVAGDRVFLAHDHAETAAGDPSLSGGGTASQPIPHICVNSAGSVPPVAADVTTGATVTNSSAGFNITFGANKAYYEGIAFISALQIPFSTDSDYKFKNCTLKGANTTAVDFNSSSRLCIEMENSAFDFTAVGQSVRLIGIDFIWRNTANPLPGTIPTSLFNLSNSARGTTMLIDGVDFSAAGSGKNIFVTPTGGQIKVNVLNSKFNAAATIVSGAVSHGNELNFYGCEGTALLRQTYSAIKSKETTIVRTGGASDGVETISWKIVANSSNNRTYPFECWPIAIWNDTVGSPVTATIEIETDGVTLTDAEAWLDAEYLGTAASDLASVVSSGPATALSAGANLPTSSEAWTTTGQGSPVKQYLSVTFTPQKAGIVRLYVKVAKASTTLYVCPKPALA